VNYDTLIGGLIVLGLATYGAMSLVRDIANRFER
jgi:hypothetical protein